MRRTHRLAQVLIAGIAALALAGCATTRVNGFLERGMNLGQYRSYAWASPDRFSTGDPRLDNNEFFQTRMQEGVGRELTARGMEEGTLATAALIVHVHASVHQQMDVNALDAKYGYCEACHSSVYDAGTITIDFVDSRTNRLVWRGWSEGTLDGIDSQPMLEARVDEAVSRIMRLLPPHL